MTAAGVCDSRMIEAKATPESLFFPAEKLKLTKSKKASPHVHARALPFSTASLTWTLRAAPMDGPSASLPGSGGSAFHAATQKNHSGCALSS